MNTIDYLWNTFVSEFMTTFAIKKKHTMENNETVQKLGMDLLKETDVIDYTDGDIVIIDDLKSLPVEGSLKLDMIFALLCVEGRLQLDINGKTYLVHAGEMIISPPNAFVDNYMISPDFDAKILGLSYISVQRSLHAGKDIWNMMMYVSQNPVFHLSEEDIQLLNNYYALVCLKMKQPQHSYYKETMQALFQSAFYELCAVISRSMKPGAGEWDDSMRQADILFKRFIELLSGGECRERSVNAFAGKLCITPKYLSAAIKKVSGKTALEWIHEYTTKAIVHQLKYTNKSIKEIADELDFPNLSFFGKFVKTQLGVSPKEYRKQLGTSSTYTTPRKGQLGFAKGQL